MASKGILRNTRNMGDHKPSECNHTVHGQYIHKKVKTAKDGKELIEIRQSNDVRNLIVPKREPLDVPGILPKSEFERLKKQACVLTAAEKKAMLEEAEKKQIELMKESQERKDLLKKAQLEQTAGAGSTLNQAEADAARKSQYLLQRAYELRQEQEDEIKGINRVILARKCLAIREAQIAEKKLIEKELTEEERRLDMMMEQTRQRGLQQEKQKLKEAEARNHSFVQEIQHQLKEIEIKELIEAERKEEEARAMNKALVAMKEEELEAAKKKLEKKLQIRAEMKQANDDLDKYRAMQREEENIANAKLAEFMRKKAEREELLEKEANDIRNAKAREAARMEALQMRAGDLIAQRQEQHAYRLQEEAERAWRKKEKEDAVKKKKAIADLRRDRLQQIEDIRAAQAVQIAQDEEEFRKVAKMQYEVFKKDEAQRQQRKEQAYKNRMDILEQVNQKEKERIEMQKSKIEDGQALVVERELRELRVKNAIERKINYLRECNVSEQSLADIQRQANATLHRQKNAM